MNALKPKAPFQALIMSEESRLGREQIEVRYALKQFITGGVRVFCYLTDSERTLNSPIEKAMLALSTMADEMEREKARQRTRDAMVRKAKAGYVTSGLCFGYDNLVIETPDGRRSHVERRLNEAEAAVIRRIFALCARGMGMKQIAHTLNAEHAACPRPQQRRPAGWAPSSIPCILHRPLYRGEIVWDRSKKRDTWGQHKQTRRPEAEWLRVSAPALRIVTETEWTAAHHRLGEARACYLRHNDGKVWGHPARGVESKYLLVGLATCGVCGGGLSVRTSANGKQRARYYVCTANYHGLAEKCPNARNWPMDDLDALVLEALGDQVLSEDAARIIVQRVVEGYKRLKPREDGPRVEAEIAALDGELARLTNAPAGGGALASELAGMKDRETRRDALRAELERLALAPVVSGLDP
jgi:DNA invertase Pin-like site-specific DNA recombinase